MRKITQLIVFISLILLFVSAIAEATTTRVIVMPYKLVGDLGNVKIDSQHQQRLTMANAELRKGLSASKHYDLVDETASQDFSKKVIEALSNNNCNKCESAWAKELNAKQIVVPWVYRLSQLVLTMHFDVIDTDSGKIILKKSLDFRGDNDQSWQRAIEYFLENVNKP